MDMDELDIIEEEEETSKFNPAKEFNDAYSKDVQYLLHVPLVAKCKENNELIPYEYSKHTLKYRRNEDEVNHMLAHKAQGLVIYCLKNKIDKGNILNFRGGNLWAHDNNIKAYAK